MCRFTLKTSHRNRFQPIGLYDPTNQRVFRRKKWLADKNRKLLQVSKPAWMLLFRHFYENRTLDAHICLVANCELPHRSQSGVRVKPYS